jgi:hypothetical protein
MINAPVTLKAPLLLSKRACAKISQDKQQWLKAAEVDWRTYGG